MLDEHSMRAKARSIAHQIKDWAALLCIRDGQAWGSGESCLQATESPFSGSNPSKRSVFAQQQSQWHRTICVALNVLAKDAGQAKELLNSQ